MKWVRSVASLVSTTQKAVDNPTKSMICCVSDCMLTLCSLAEIRQMVSSLQWQEGDNHSRATHELSILEPVLTHVQQLNTAQTKALTNREQEVNHFRDTMNSRLEYYKALQRISDQVAPYKEETIGEPLDERLCQAFLAEEAKLQQKIVSVSAKLRYLVHMKTDSKSSAPRVCVICTDQFEVGTMTAVSNP